MMKWFKKRALRKHINLRALMIKQYEGMLAEADPEEVALLKAILADNRKALEDRKDLLASM